MKWSNVLLGRKIGVTEVIWVNLKPFLPISIVKGSWSRTNIFSLVGTKNKHMDIGYFTHHKQNVYHFFQSTVNFPIFWFFMVWNRFLVTPVSEFRISYKIREIFQRHEKSSIWKTAKNCKLLIVLLPLIGHFCTTFNSIGTFGRFLRRPIC